MTEFKKDDKVRFLFFTPEVKGVVVGQTDDGRAIVRVSRKVMDMEAGDEAPIADFEMELDEEHNQ